MVHPPITAIVIFRNEKRDLERCLHALQWCDEVIAVDMESSDGSLEVAQKLADRVFYTHAFPIAEPTRVAAARLARNDWILLVDPDEFIPPPLRDDIQCSLVAHGDAGAFCLPMWFYFKGTRLEGTIWGTLTFKRRLVHRHRCDLLPLCNRLTQMRSGYREYRIEAKSNDHHMHHYWSNSYLDLLYKHFRRYSHLEAAALVAQGQRFSLRLGLIAPLLEIKRSLKDFDGWRLGLRGWLLSAIYFGYTVASHWLTLYYQWRGVPSEEPADCGLPQLIEIGGVCKPQRKAA